MSESGCQGTYCTFSKFASAEGLWRAVSPKFTADSKGDSSCDTTYTDKPAEIRRTPGDGERLLGLLLPALSGHSWLAYVRQLIAPHVSVPFNVIEADFVDDHAAFEGGRRMTNGGAVCTSGFTAYHSGDNRYGLITAGHCDQSTWTTQGVTLDFKVRAYNASNDAAFYMIPQGQGHSVTNRVRCSDNSGTVQTCPINSVGPGRLFMQGHYVCHMGTNSGVSCGTVDNVRYKPNPPRGCDGNGTECRPVFMRACSGDSGGPVFSYSAAYGIHKGGPRNNPCNRDNSYIIFSGIRRVQIVLGVAVVTNWPSSVP